MNPSNDDFYLAPNKSFLLVSKERAFVSGYFAMRHSRVSGGSGAEASPARPWERGAQGDFRLQHLLGQAGETETKTLRLGSTRTDRPCFSSSTERPVRAGGHQQGWG